MCTLAQTPTTTHHHQHTNNTMNNSNLYNNIILILFSVNFKGNVMKKMINAIGNFLFNKSMNFHSELEVDVMCNDIQYVNDYDVDLTLPGYEHSTDTEEQQIADMQWAFEAEIDALYGEHDDEVSLSADTMAIILAYAAEGAAKARANSVNEEDAMYEGEYEGEDMSEEDMEALLKTLEGLDETEEDDMNNDEDNTMFSIMPVLMAFANVDMTQERIMVLVALVAMIVAIIATFVAMFSYEKKQKAKKLAIAERTRNAELEQIRCFYAAVEMERRERNIAYYREQAEQARQEEARIAAAVLAEETRQRQIQEEEVAQQQKRKAERALQREAVNESNKANKLAEVKGHIYHEIWQFNVKIINFKPEELWQQLDQKEEKKFTLQDLLDANEIFENTGDAKFFFENATIQGIRQFWLVNSRQHVLEIKRLKNLPIFWFFYEFITAVERSQVNNNGLQYQLSRTAVWSSTQILTKAEYAALEQIVADKGMDFFAGWALPLNTAATGGLILAMSKDLAFAEEISSVKRHFEFWHSTEMNSERSLWKAAQWKIYLQRYNKVNKLKVDAWPSFAEGFAECKLTTDIVVGFNFDKKESRSCEVGDTEQIAMILDADYDQVLRIRRTDAAGIWNESQQINKKYTGNFCTGRGNRQEEGYYQRDFLENKKIPWIADIQINGEWDNFGVILTNSAGVADFGMGNKNRSEKHRPILHAMFGTGDDSLVVSKGQRRLEDMTRNWFTHREMNINKVIAEIRAELENQDGQVTDDAW